MPARTALVAVILCLPLLLLTDAISVMSEETIPDPARVRVMGIDMVDLAGHASSTQPSVSGAPGFAELTIIEGSVTVRPSHPSNPDYALTNVLGEILNETESTVYIASLQVVTLDGEGKLLDAVRTSVPGIPPCEIMNHDWSLLGPGESNPFSMHLSSNFNDVASVIIRAIGSEFSRDPCSTTAELVDEWEATEDWPERSKLTGVVRNQNSTDIIDLRITVAARDSSGAVVALDHEYPWSEIIGGYTGGLRAGDEIIVSLHLNVSVEDLQGLSLETRITGRPYEGGRFRYGVVGIAHGPGANGSLWRSSLALTNLSGAPAGVVLSYYHAGARADALFDIGAGKGVILNDVARSLFGVAGHSAGYIQITSSAPLTLTGRTSNETDLGGFGQSLPVYTPEMTGNFWFGDLSGLRGGGAFRTNIGLVNMAEYECSCRVRVFGLDGSLLREFSEIELDETEWKQLNDVIPGDVDFAYATVDSGQGCLMWAYASVIEESTGDPTTIEVASPTIIDLAPRNQRGVGWSFGGWPEQPVSDP